MAALGGLDEALSGPLFEGDGGRDIGLAVLAPELRRLEKEQDPRKWALLRTLEGHGDSVFSVAFSPGGGRVASGSQDGTVRIWGAGP